ncbi:MAG TPA: hypothetical protein VD905_09935 [Flavobacteriales bacterium]|nr:hypothetical protein [Flavobacteriales bacterium]
MAACSLQGQQFLPEYVQYDTVKKMTLRTAAHFNYQTSTIPNYFLNYFLNGGTISQGDKDNVSAGLKNTNSIGTEQFFSVRFTDFSGHPFKDSTLGYYLNVEHQDHIAANFNKTLFDLVFYGNGPYAGQTLNLANANFARYTFQKFGFGITEVTSGSSFGISVVKGQSFATMNLTKGNFLTDDSTANISFEYAADISRSDTLKTKLDAFNGVGMSIDLNWNFKLGRDTVLPDLLNFQLQVHNAGFIVWNQSTLNYTADSVAQYNGFEVNNVLRPEEGLITGNTDLKDTLNIRYEKKKRQSLLPADFLLGNYVNPLKGYWLKPLYGVRYKLMEGYKFMPYAGASIRVTKKSFLQVTGSYGGFGGFRAGVRYQAQLGKKMHVVIGSSHVDGLYSPNGFGKDGYAALWFRF